jgi:hypothetical protein
MDVSDAMIEKVNISESKKKHPLHKLNSMKSHNIHFMWNYIEPLKKRVLLEAF